MNEACGDRTRRDGRTSRRAEKAIALRPTRWSGDPDRGRPAPAGRCVGPVNLLPLYVSSGSRSRRASKKGPATGVRREKQEAELRRAAAPRSSARCPPPRGQFPNLTAERPTILTSGSGDDRFEFGMSVLVAGLEAVSNSWPEAKPADVPRSAGAGLRQGSSGNGVESVHFARHVVLDGGNDCTNPATPPTSSAV